MRMENSDEEYFTCDEDFTETSISWTIDWPKSKKTRKQSIEPKTQLFNVDYKLSHRKVLDIRRLYCISRPQYAYSCGISSVVSVFNFLYSYLGVGSRVPITQEEALINLGFQPPYNTIRFGPFTGNITLIRWFRKLCLVYGLKGEASILYKPVGNIKTNKTSDSALQELKDGLLTECKAYIYHCYNHYFCPIGFEIDHENPELAYSNLDCKDCDSTETWIFIGDPSKKYSPIHCIKWTDIVTDLESTGPERLNVRKLYLGVCIQKGRQTKDVCTQVYKTYEDVVTEEDSGENLLPDHGNNGNNRTNHNDELIFENPQDTLTESVMNDEEFKQNDHFNKPPKKPRKKISNLHCIIEFKRL